MNILFLCNKSPWPAHEGGPMAMNSLISSLADAGHYVKVLAVVSDKFMVKPEEVPESFRKKTSIEFVYIDLSIKPLDAFINLFTRNSYHVQRFISDAFRDKLIDVLSHNTFDIIQLETLFMTPYVPVIRQHSQGRIVLRSHNIEHLIWKRMSQVSRNPLKRFYLKHLSSTLRRYETRSTSLYDGIAAITRKDAAFFRSLTTTAVVDIPFGINQDDFQVIEKEVEWPGLFHIGSMNWMPNEEGIKWFLDQVWPLVQQNHPEVTITLAGRFMPDWLKTGYKENVVVIGEVESAREFVKAHSIAIVPLLSGSGIRIKIIEAMAQGRTVITTQVGAEGINYSDHHNILIANTPTAFAQAISDCIANKEMTLSIGRAARELIEEHYDNRKIVKRLVVFYQELLQQPVV
ncbi:MAG: glycosyltransferase family 4 protein [Bacteroidales bacterium]|nr:glycosyltransferase family 4 protein [Bacteroidales bacterium]